MDYHNLFATDISNESVRAWRASGKKAVGIVCCHMPPEIFHALDILPVRMRGTGCTDASGAEAWMSSFSCSFAKSILQYIMDGRYELDGIVATDGCAMATRLFDNVQHLNTKEGWGKFLYFLNAPRTSGDLAEDFYKDELIILAGELEKLSGNKLSDEKLKASIALYNEARSLVKEIYEMRKAEKPVLTGEEALKVTMAFGDYPIEEYIEMLKAYVSELKARKPLEGSRARLVLIGSALDDPNYVKIIEDKGGLVVGDVLCYGSRCFESNCTVDDSDVMGSLAKY